VQHQQLVIKLVGLDSACLMSDHELLRESQHRTVYAVPVILSGFGGCLSCRLAREQQSWIKLVK
jgi:hypothetical protein